MRITLAIFVFVLTTLMVSYGFAQTSEDKFKYAASFTVTGGKVRLLEDAEWGDCKVKFLHIRESWREARPPIAVIPDEAEGMWYNPFSWFGNSDLVDKPKDFSVEFSEKPPLTTIDFNKLNWNSARYEYELGEPSFFDKGTFFVKGMFDGEYEEFSVEMDVAVHRHEKAVQDIVKMCPGIFGY